MKGRIFAGIMAALLAIVLPFLMMGMGERQTLPQTAAETQSPAPSQRRVSEIVVHQNAQRSGDSAVTLTVEIGGVAEELTLEDYLVGVLMGEMPASFPLEALKAQAVAARTYTLRRLETGGVLSDDPTVCQAYIPIEDAEEKFGTDAQMYLEKLRQAVTETAGQVLTYEGALITATYFSSAGGRTESAQAVWGSDVPYLVSVESPDAPAAGETPEQVTVTREAFLEKLEITDLGVSQVTYTQGGGVDTMIIGGKSFSGTALREYFGLRSTAFTLEIGETEVTFTTTGYGHRVGMSQYGAKAMAEAGDTYEQILTWYYTGVSIEVWEEKTGSQTGTG